MSTLDCLRESDSSAMQPARDLYCLDLVPAPDHRSARGVLELRQAPTPFGVAVTADGRAVLDLVLHASHLPDPETLGPYTTYVAWASPPTLHPMVRLGKVEEGRSALGTLAMNAFIVFVSAEASGDVETRTGPLVLRGMSPSMRMGDAHLLSVGGGRGEADTDMHHAAAHGLHWSMPPMDTRVAPMPMPGIEHAVPAVTPWLPGSGRDRAGIPIARERSTTELQHGDTLRLDAWVVRRTLGGREELMLAFNGEHPGPLIVVEEGAEVFIDFGNALEWPTAVHWHGLRLDNASDGVPGVTQPFIAPGERFLYKLRFPDTGIFWYHPHHREDAQQDLGLVGNILVRPRGRDPSGAPDREEVLVLDDILIGEGGLIPYGEEHTTHAIMGRFGNRMLVNGSETWAMNARAGEVVRLYLTNAANVRPFNLSIPGARMKLIASDVGRFEREQWVESVAIAPAERYVVDVRFDAAGDYPLLNRVQALDHGADRFFAVHDTVGIVRVAPAAADVRTSDFDKLRAHADVSADVAATLARGVSAPLRQLLLTLEDTGLSYPLEQLLRLDAPYFQPVEWEGTMPMMDWLPTGDEVRWIIRDVETGRENHDIDWEYTEGDLVRVRLHNDRGAIHAMQHPIHIHGQRFLVLAVNGVRTQNHAWKDTVLVPVGATVDVLLELSNPGTWMGHCHIAEHLSAGMHFGFTVHPN